MDFLLWKVDFGVLNRRAARRLAPGRAPWHAPPSRTQWPLDHAPRTQWPRTRCLVPRTRRALGRARPPPRTLDQPLRPRLPPPSPPPADGAPPPPRPPALGTPAAGAPPPGWGGGGRRALLAGNPARRGAFGGIRGRREGGEPRARRVRGGGIREAAPELSPRWEGGVSAPSGDAMNAPL